MIGSVAVVAASSLALFHSSGGAYPAGGRGIAVSILALSSFSFYAYQDLKSDFKSGEISGKFKRTSET